METVFAAVIAILLLNIFLSLVGIWRARTPAEKVAGTNLIGTKVMAIMVIMAFYRREAFILDVALTYTLVGYIATILVAKYLEIFGAR